MKLLGKSLFIIALCMVLWTTYMIGVNDGEDCILNIALEQPGEKGQR